jgi:hypothetical protein
MNYYRKSWDTCDTCEAFFRQVSHTIDGSQLVMAKVILGELFFTHFSSELVISSKSCKYAVSIYLLHEKGKKKV